MVPMQPKIPNTMNTPNMKWIASTAIATVIAVAAVYGTWLLADERDHDELVAAVKEHSRPVAVSVVAEYDKEITAKLDGLEKRLIAGFEATDQRIDDLKDHTDGKLDIIIQQTQ